MNWDSDCKCPQYGCMEGNKPNSQRKEELGDMASFIVIDSTKETCLARYLGMQNLVQPDYINTLNWYTKQREGLTAKRKSYSQNTSTH